MKLKPKYQSQEYDSQWKLFRFYLRFWTTDRIGHAFWWVRSLFWRCYTCQKSIPAEERKLHAILNRICLNWYERAVMPNCDECHAKLVGTPNALFGDQK